MLRYTVSYQASEVQHGTRQLRYSTVQDKIPISYQMWACIAHLAATMIINISYGKFTISDKYAEVSSE